MLDNGTHHPVSLQLHRLLGEHTASILNPEDESRMFLRKICVYLQVLKPLQAGRLKQTNSLPLELQISDTFILQNQRYFVEILSWFCSSSNTALLIWGE